MALVTETTDTTRPTGGIHDTPRTDMPTHNMPIEDLDELMQYRTSSAAGSSGSNENLQETEVQLASWKVIWTHAYGSVSAGYYFYSPEVLIGSRAAILDPDSGQNIVDNLLAVPASADKNYYCLIWKKEKKDGQSTVTSYEFKVVEEDGKIPDDTSDTKYTQLSKVHICYRGTGESFSEITQKHVGVINVSLGGGGSNVTGDNGQAVETYKLRDEQTVAITLSGFGQFQDPTCMESSSDPTSVGSYQAPCDGYIWTCGTCGCATYGGREGYINLACGDETEGEYSFLVRKYKKVDDYETGAGETSNSVDPTHPRTSTLEYVKLHMVNPVIDHASLSEVEPDKGETGPNEAPQWQIKDFDCNTCSLGFVPYYTKNASGTEQKVVSPLPSTFTGATDLSSGYSFLVRKEQKGEKPTLEYMKIGLPIISGGSAPGAKQIVVTGTDGSQYTFTGADEASITFRSLPDTNVVVKVNSGCSYGNNLVLDVGVFWVN